MTEIEFLHEMVKAAGGDPNMLKDKLKSTYYECIINCLNNGGGSSGEYTQPEWGYKEGAFLPETEVTLSANADMGGMVMGTIDASDFESRPVIGNNYTVIYDGAEYPVTYKAAGDFMGNQFIFGEGENTGEPFMLAHMGEGAFAVIPANQAEGTVKISIRGTIIKKIESEYAPDLPYIDLVGLGLGVVTTTSATQVDIEHDFYYEHVKPKIMNGDIKVKICLSGGIKNALSPQNPVVLDGSERIVFLHPSLNEDGNYKFFTIFELGILYVYFNAEIIYAVIRPFDSASFVLDGSLG